MNHAIIIHGWEADSQSNWFPWLKQELENKGWKVDCPDFPNTQWPKLPEWIEYFENVVARLVLAKNKQPQGLQLQLIGHSLGVPFILRYLENVAAASYAANIKCDRLAKLRVNASYLVAGFHKPLGFAATENFLDKPFDWKKIKKACKKFVVINSDNDPYIPREIGRELAEKLEVEEILEHNGEHLNAPGGFLEYPRLLKLITDNS